MVHLMNMKMKFWLILIISSCLKLNSLRILTPIHNNKRSAVKTCILNLSENDTTEEEKAKQLSRPPIIPFDFARDDLPDKKVQELVKFVEQEKSALENKNKENNKPEVYSNP
jgi:hypothetical protein